MSHETQYRAKRLLDWSKNRVEFWIKTGWNFYNCYWIIFLWSVFYVLMIFEFVQNIILIYFMWKMLRILTYFLNFFLWCSLIIKNLYLFSYWVCKFDYVNDATIDHHLCYTKASSKDFIFKLCILWLGNLFYLNWKPKCYFSQKQYQHNSFEIVAKLITSNRDDLNKAKLFVINVKTIK